MPPDFLEHHWRRQPIHLPGSATDFLPEAPSRAEITERIRGGAPHQTDGATVWFLEGLTSGLTGVAELVSRARSWFEWHDVWCDAFATVGPSSIGSHYDGSDNFSIQLTGNKTWFLSDPQAVHPEDRRRRILGEPGLGAAAMPPLPQVFEVQAGDVLYIPSNWIHWGVSDGDSTSVSLVVNVATPFHALQEQILDGLRHDPGWSVPLAVGPGSAVDRARVLGELIRRDLPEQLRSDITARIGGREGSSVTLKGYAIADDAPTADASWADAYLTRTVPSPEDPGPRGALVEGLNRLRAHRNLGRLLGVCAERYVRTDSAEPRRIYAAVSAGLRTLPHETLDSLLTDPELGSWLAVAEHDSGMAGGRNRVEDPLAHALGLAVLPEIATAVAQLGPLTLRVTTDEDGSLTLRRSGMRLCFPDRPGHVVLGLREDGLHRLGPVDVEERQRHAPLPLATAGVVLTGTRTDWLARVAPETTLGEPAEPTSEWADLVDGTLRSLAGEDGSGSDWARLVPWLLLRRSAGPHTVDDHPVLRLPGLAVAGAERPEQLALVLAAARARAEFELAEEAFPLLDATAVPGGRRKSVRLALRRGYVRARLNELLPTGATPTAAESDRPDDSLLTPWGRALLSRS